MAAEKRQPGDNAIVAVSTFDEEEDQQSTEHGKESEHHKISWQAINVRPTPRYL